MAFFVQQESKLFNMIFFYYDGVIDCIYYTVQVIFYSVNTIYITFCDTHKLWTVY